MSNRLQACEVQIRTRDAKNQEATASSPAAWGLTWIEPMHKGRSPNKSRQNVTPQTIESPLDEGATQQSLQDSGARNTTASESPCWEFRVVRATPALAEVVIGEIVSGSYTGHDLMIHSASRGVLGFAPSKTAKSIVAANQGNRSVHLAGAVTRVLDTTVWVNLCLR